jgi:hypothetical protein
MEFAKLPFETLPQSIRKDTLKAFDECFKVLDRQQRRKTGKISMDEIDLFMLMVEQRPVIVGVGTHSTTQSARLTLLQQYCADCAVRQSNRLAIFLNFNHALMSDATGTLTKSSRTRCRRQSGSRTTLDSACAERC